MPDAAPSPPRMQVRAPLAIAILVVGVGSGIASEGASAGPFELSDAIVRAAVITLFIVAWKLVERAIACREDA